MGIRVSKKKTDTFWNTNQPRISLQKLEYSHMGIQNVNCDLVDKAVQSILHCKSVKVVCDRILTGAGFLLNANFYNSCLDLNDFNFHSELDLCFRSIDSALICYVLYQWDF